MKVSMTDNNAIRLYQPAYLWKHLFSSEAIAIFTDGHFLEPDHLRLVDVCSSFLKPLLFYIAEHQFELFIIFKYDYILRNVVIRLSFFSNIEPIDYGMNVPRGQNPGKNSWTKFDTRKN